MKQQPVLFFFFIILCTNTLRAQTVLPEFNLKQIDKEKCLISWHNPFKNCTELFIQRSSDNKKFKTLKAAKKPSLFENSFTDTKSPKSKNSITEFSIA